MANSVVSSVTHRLLPFRPAMIFVNDSQGDRALAAAFQQNALQRVRQVPLGSAGEAAIYTEHFHELSLLRKILLRMRSWQNYVFPESL
jgi:hypothetical protein